MNTFQQLDIPRSVGSDGKWVVLAAQDMLLVLLKSGELEYGPQQVVKDYQFDTEPDAWYAMAHYYYQNHEPFPHTSALLGSPAYSFAFDENIESQVMDF